MLPAATRLAALCVYARGTQPLRKLGSQRLVQRNVGRQQPAEGRVCLWRREVLAQRDETAARVDAPVHTRRCEQKDR